MEIKKKENDWTTVIKPRSNLLEIDFKEIWRYRDLLVMFVKRDIVTMYKQTILGPLWFFINPIFTTVVYMVVFGGIAKISTDGLPQALFYLSGIVCWNFFSDVLTKSSDTFITNSSIFGKVYFPRLIVPLSLVVSNLLKMLIQFALFVIVYIYFVVTGVDIAPNYYALLFPVLVLLLAGQGLAFGLVFTSMTTKYRDLKFLLAFGVSLWQYATPIIYPLSTISPDKRWIMELNPLTSIVETFKYGFLGQGTFSWMALGYTAIFTIVLLALSVVIFNRVQKSFMDTV